MKILLILSLISMSALAGIKTNIIQLEEGTSNTDNTDVLVSWNGRVFEVNPMNTGLVAKLKKAQNENLEVELEIESGIEFEVTDEVEEITAVKLLNKNKNIDPTENLSVDPMLDYTPTDLSSYEEANNVFQSLEEDHKNRSQCYNRAYIWSKRMDDRFGIKSMKIFIFYTKRYREEVSKKWWYHVAPMVSVAGEFMVMDREFTRTPKSAEAWEKVFTKKMERKTGIKNYRCLKMNNINAYYESNNYNNEFCNIQYANMYFWGPNDLKAAARKGTMQTKWVNSKLRYASKEAFKKWRKVYESVKVQQ